MILSLQVSGIIKDAPDQNSDRNKPMLSVHSKSQSGATKEDFCSFCFMHYLANLFKEEETNWTHPEEKAFLGGLGCII